MRKNLALLALLLFAGAVRPAAAASCTIASVTPVVFGTYSGMTEAVSSTLTIQCTSGLAYNIGLSAGTAGGATVYSRAMIGPSATLGYGLFSDAGHSVIWGNSSGTGWVSGTGTGATQQVIIYAQIPSGENVAAGSYSDTVTVTLSGNFSTATVQFNVSATVLKACTVSATPLAFGGYSGVLLSSTATISTTCTLGTAYSVGLDAGRSSGATVTNRAMTGPSPSLMRYNLFRDAGYSSNWGNTPGADTVAGTGSGVVQYLTVFGQVPAAQPNLKAGSYNDTVTVTVTY
jgi:spore coat protein U-like protein